MKVFISWSGKRSKAVAVALEEWLPTILNAVQPLVSFGIEKGTRSMEEINTALASTGFGIICLERANLQSPWIHFEAGAIARQHQRVWTLLVDVSYADVLPPLSQFQHTVINQEEIRALLSSMNASVAVAGETSLTERQLSRAFDLVWGKLGSALEAAKELMADEPPTPTRLDRDILEEILGIVRASRKDETIASLNMTPATLTLSAPPRP